MSELVKIVGKVRAAINDLAADDAGLLRGIKDAADAIRRWEEAEKLRQAVTVETLRGTTIDANDGRLDDGDVDLTGRQKEAGLLVGMNVIESDRVRRMYHITEFGKMLADAISDNDRWRAAMERVGSRDKAETAFVEACSYALTAWVEHQWCRNMLEGGK